MGVVKERARLAFGSVQFGKEGNALFLRFLLDILGMYSDRLTDGAS